MSPAPRRGRAPRTESHVPAAVVASGPAEAGPPPARLCLDVAGAPYGLAPLWEGPGGLRSFRLRSPAGADYTVRRDCLGVITCDCPDATYRPDRPGGCKHARALVEVRLLDPPGATS